MNDPTVFVAVISAIGVVISGGFGVLVAVITNRKEKKSTAEIAAEQAADKAAEEKEEALRERILLRDEQLLAAQKRIQELEAENSRLRGGP